MWARKTGLFVVVILILVGCSAPATVPTVMPNTPTIPVISSETFAPTATIQPIPTTTPEAPLQTSGPHFLYFREVDGEYQLVVMDADGKGRKVISLPEGSVDALTNKQYGLDMRFISPDGKWLAFYTGSAGEWGREMPQGTFDLTLNLLDLTTGKKQVVTPVLSGDYPNNFVEISKTSKDAYPSADLIRGAFLGGITSAISWSPDSHYLAFAAQIDGLSSDLYVYDMSKGKIQRLTDGIEQMQWIEWSSDGKWILHGSVYAMGEGVTDNIYAVTPDGKSLRSLSIGHFGGWFDNYSYFEYDSQNGPGNYGLRLIDINTSKVTKLWSGSFLSYEADLSGRWVLIATLLPDADPFSHPEPDYDFVPGLYLIDLKTMKKSHIDYPPDEIVLDYEFTSIKSDGAIFFLDSYYFSGFLSSAAQVTPYDLGDGKVSFSPRLQYWTAVSNEEIKIFSADNALLKSIPFTSNTETQEFEINWRPDDSGFFLNIEKEIYTVNISSGSVDLVETRLNNTYGQKFMWINEK
jgi:hypothetical protein